MNKMNYLNVDKSTWELCKLGDIASEVSVRVDNPAKSKYERFVGLEDFESGELEIRKWGTTENLTSSAKAFQKGDILFARRNAYLRRASYVDFDGCCSGDAFVLRENPQKIVSGYLSLLMNSNALWDFANSNAAGTMSKRVKWRDLAEYSFLLPSKEKQQELVKLLFSAYHMLRMDQELEIKLKIARQETFEHLVKLNDGYQIELSKVLIPKKSKSSPIHERTKYVGLEHIESGELSCSAFGNSNDMLATCNVIDVGDLCYSKLRPYLDKAFIAEFDAVSTTELLVFRTKLVSESYVLYYLHSKPFIEYVSAQGFGTKMPRVSNEIIGKFRIKVVKDEGEILQSMEYFNKAISDVKEKIKLNRLIFNRLINNLL